MFRKIACAPDCPGLSGGNVRECERRVSCAYARIFEPASMGDGPSGLGDWPRPFVFRAAHLDGTTVGAGEKFWFEVNFFDTRDPPLKYFVPAFQQLARGRAELVSAEQLDRVSILLDGAPADVRRLRVEFKTPTELKGGDRPEFGVLFARSRDRISTLRALYGPGPLEIDFRAMGERASTVRMTRCELRHVDAERRSSRTGQVHGIGGFVGVAEYEGELGEFVPYLEAARWTGVGRQCVWGKGELCVTSLPPSCVRKEHA
ncbi:MAG TPA: CRISPR system precrRNA processing endoribonuclease RAMP protein Cas6 [Bryobacteraceae bacterium]